MFYVLGAYLAMLLVSQSNGSSCLGLTLPSTTSAGGLPLTIAPRTSWLSLVLVSSHSITCKLNFQGNPRLWTSFLTLGTLFTPVVQLYQCLICVSHLDSEGTKSHDGLFGRTLHQIPILLVCFVTLFVNISLFVILIDCADYTFSPSLII